jgi:acetyltransferase
MKDGDLIVIRPICPEDEFHESLSDQSVYFRYFHMISLGQRVDHDRLSRTCLVDYHRSIALIAERNDRQIIAVGRLVQDPSESKVELAVLVSDAFQNRDLGTELVKRLLEIALSEKCCRVYADVLPENTAMQHVFRNLGFQISYTSQDGMKAERVLDLGIPIEP